MGLWTLYDKVKVVLNAFNMGYIVDVNNESQLKSAMHWASAPTWDYAQKKRIESFEPIVKEFDNSGFKISLHDSANGSSQGGKLSFWTCKVEKDGFTFYTGINADLLFDFMMKTTIINGEFQDAASFARRNGNVGILHSGMEQYQQAVEDMNHKGKVKTAKKTSTREVGYHYYLSTIDEMYLGKVYKWCDYEYSSGYRPIKLIFKKKPEVYYLTARYDPELTKVSDYFNEYFYFEKKTAARIKSEERIEVDVDNNYIDNYYLNKVKNNFGKARSGRYYDTFNYIYDLMNTVVSTNGNECPNDLRDEIVKQIAEWNSHAPDKKVEIVYE